MKNLVCAGIAAALLAACGGGGGSTSAASSQAGVTAPAVSASASTVDAGNSTISGNAKDYLIKFAGSGDVTITAQIANVWVAENQALGTLAVSGGMNTITFKAGATVKTLNVTGSGNTIYLPAGSPIVVQGTAAASTTVKYYTS